MTQSRSPREPALSLWHRTPGARRPFPPLDAEIVHVARDAAARSAYETGLATPLAAPTEGPGAHDETPWTLEECASATPSQALVCRISTSAEASGETPEATLGAIGDELCEALDGIEDLDPYELASAFYQLGLARPAVLLLERAIRLHGAGVRICELMARCLLALDRPELARHWAIRPLRTLEPDSEAAFELVRLASVCQMQMPDENPCRAGHFIHFERP